MQSTRTHQDTRRNIPDTFFRSPTVPTTYETSRRVVVGAQQPRLMVIHPQTVAKWREEAGEQTPCHMIKYLLGLSVSNPGQTGPKLATQLPAAEFALETFGNTRTPFSPNASHFERYAEPQFSDCGRPSGINTLDCYLF